MKKLVLLPTLVALVALLGAAACGDDSTMMTTDSAVGVDSSAPDADTGTPPNNCPFEMEQTPPCCYRASNAENLDAPQLRISGVQLSTPDSLANIVVTSLLTTSLDDELFNWLLTADITGAVAEITTGYGIKNADSSFSFTTGTAPGPGDPNRWDPVTVTGAIDGETVSAPQLTEVLTVPVLNDDGSEVTLELPLRNMTLDMAELSEDRSCVGSRLTGGRWNVMSGALRAFISVEDADAGILSVPDAGINTTLCMFTAGMPSEPEGTTCADVDQATWAVKPDAICEASGTCTQDPGDGSVCDPSTTCNAWFLQAGFAAQGVVITD